jgi:hypothetical protein
VRNKSYEVMTLSPLLLVCIAAFVRPKFDESRNENESRFTMNQSQRIYIRKQPKVNTNI